MRTYWKKRIGDTNTYELIHTTPMHTKTMIEHDYERIKLTEAIELCKAHRNARKLGGKPVTGDCYIYPLEWDYNTPIELYKIDSHNNYIVTGKRPKSSPRHIRFDTRIYE